MNSGENKSFFLACCPKVILGAVEKEVRVEDFLIEEME